MNPLPLIDGCLFVDNSGWMESITTCPRSLEYKQLYKRIPASETPALNFGSAIHLALEHRYKHYLAQPVGDQFYNEIAALFNSFFESHPPQMEDYRDMNWAMEVVKRYMQRYSTETFSLLVGADNKPIVELAFALPLYTHWMQHPEAPDEGQAIPVFYTGKIDLPIELDNQIFVCDHKTTSILGDGFFSAMKRTAQMRGYCWAFEQLTGKKVQGYMVNAIRVKQPPTYVNDPNARRTKTQSPEQWWQESLQRERYHLNPGELDEWKANTIANVEEMFWHYERGYFPMRTTYCVSKYGRCPYFDVCSLQSHDRGAYLASGLFQDQVWSPLNKTTQSKQ